MLVQSSKESSLLRVHYTVIFSSNDNFVEVPRIVSGVEIFLFLTVVREFRKKKIVRFSVDIFFYFPYKRPI